MNLKDLEYILAIAEEQNITRAAEKLYVTPSALTQLIARTERELGTALFLRSRSGCVSTEAGAVYVDAARRMLALQQETYRRIYDAASCKNTVLTIGFPPEHGATMFTAVYPAFREQYPDIHFRIRETSVKHQQQMIAQGELDLGFMTLLDSQKTADEYIHLVDEELLIALPADAPQAAFAREDADSPFPVLELACLQDYPMAQMYQESTFRAWTESVCQAADFVPNVMFETSRHSTILRMVSAGLCGGFVTSYHCQKQFDYPNLAFFCLPDHPVWHVMACYRKGAYLSRPMREMIRLAREHWQAP